MNIGLFEGADELAITAAAEFGDGGLIDAGPAIDKIFPVGGEVGLMGAIVGGEDDEAGAVEVDAAGMEVIGVLAGADTAGAEPDLAVGFIDEIDAAHDPIAMGDLVFDLAGGGIVEVEVIPTIAFAHPDDFMGAVKVAGIFLAAVIDEGLAVFIDDGLGFAGLGVDGNDLEDLMSAPVVEVGEAAGIGPPADFVEAVGIGKRTLGHGDLAMGSDVKEADAGNRQFIAGLVIVLGE